MLELLEFSTLPLLYMTEDIQKEIEFYRRAVKINGMAIAWDVFDVCDREIILDAIKHPEGLDFLIAHGETRKKSLLELLKYILKTFFIPTKIVISLEREGLRKTKFYKLSI